VSVDQEEARFREDLEAAVNECRRIGYNPSRFLGMMSRSNAFDVARSLLHGSVSDGFTTLWERHRLDLSVEAIVLKPEWKGHFTPEERQAARRRLREVNYTAPWDDEAAASETPLAVASRESPPEIQVLLDQLKAARGDREAGKRIRASLRALGHFGGLRAREGDVERGRSRSAASHVVSTPEPPSSPSLPPIDDAEALFDRIRSLAGLPERNHEDVVRELLVRLGFEATAIVFQRNRIDVCVLGRSRKPVAVFEVKRTIAMEAERAAARRQGMDYAGQTGAVVVVVTDGDRYEVYDRRKSLDYDAMLCGRFRLTDFRPEDSKVLDLLRPDFLLSTRA
jgi:hypothetical protein